MNPEILVLFTVGTSASGKSTWAQDLGTRFPHLQMEILERDQLRREQHSKSRGTPFSWSDWDVAQESEIQTQWLERVRDLLSADVLILADTHIDPEQLAREAALLCEMGVREMAVQYFPAQPLVELIRKDQGRAYPVGAAVLREQIQRLQPEDAYWQALEAAAASCAKLKTEIVASGVPA
ncbi:AAA family ATPase [Acidithiobacillus sp. AMEEHan]|uniref:AAA family ATPase n=1 Tax=Acidithiobacillus sp. AMEEHan TaxID=2994951 RepID=UPI0027E47A9D|nr:AAA family ATPase [Acidithiobacillus sp. AMEEHan]